jgi:hypothetical protein
MEGKMRVQQEQREHLAAIAAEQQRCQVALRRAPSGLRSHFSNYRSCSGNANRFAQVTLSPSQPNAQSTSGTA